MNRRIVQRPCPECGHTQRDLVMSEEDLIEYDAVAALCGECGTEYEKPIQKGYCDSGEHYIGEAESCWRCEIMEKRRAEERRYDEIVERASALDAVRGSQWIAQEVKDLWANPEEYAAGESYSVPEGADEEAYALFRLGVAFGTDYEYTFPRDEEDTSAGTENEFRGEDR